MSRFTGGWVKLWRKAILGDIGSNYIRGGLFQALVAMANIQTSTVSWNGKPRKLERGEIATSLHELATLGEVDVKTVNRHLNYLVLRETISLEKGPTGTIIKINNYEQYQSFDAEGSTVGPHDREDHRENDVHTTGIHIEELKNIRKKERKNIACAFDFDAFALKLSSRITVPGSNARKRFNEQIKTQADFDDLIKACGNYLVVLEVEKWRTPKTSLETFLGTKASGYFWRGYLNLDVEALRKTISSKNKNYENEREVDHDAEINEAWGA